MKTRSKTCTWRRESIEFSIFNEKDSLYSYAGISAAGNIELKILEPLD